jgi:hypothetical protein
MSTQYRLVQSGKTASGGCSAGQGSSEPVAPRIIIMLCWSNIFPFEPRMILLFDLKTVKPLLTLLLKNNIEFSLTLTILNQKL